MVSKFTKNVGGSFEPNISVVIPVYNEEKRIRMCLDSIYTSDYALHKLEVVVVDDGSTDRTLQVLKQFPDVKILRQAHSGKSDALNLGVLSAAHDYILTVDADTRIAKSCIKNLVQPLSKPDVGASTGNVLVKNTNSLLGIFQNVEYYYNNMIRHSFSSVFKNAIWFYGSIACYKRGALKNAGYFKKDSLTEDMDIALELRKNAYRTINIHDAVGYTVVPSTIKGLYKQRSRWWVGGLQALNKNKRLLFSNCPSVLFLFSSQLWWSLYAIVSLPLIIYQVLYWLPYNTSSNFVLFSYLFRWFSLLGPFFVIYKLPVWGVSAYSFAGVLAGILTAIMIVYSLRFFHERITLRNALAIFFYFPYTIVLNMIILISILKFRKISCFAGD